jgi:DNA/RNA-binding domain of Phe-tRNA-synthetase-like protein
MRSGAPVKLFLRHIRSLMIHTCTIAAVSPRFPKARIAFVAACDLSIAETRPPELDALIRAREEDCRARWAGTELSQIPGVAAWREAYKGFGVRETSYRSSVERLVKRVLAGDRLPEVNTLVDIYNAVSLSHVFCSGADDLAKVVGSLGFRYAHPHDSFIDMGASEGEDPNDPPKNGEVVYADDKKVLCRRWNWRQDARSGISPATRNAIVTVQANGAGDLDAAVADLSVLIARFCGGTSSGQILDVIRPSGSLPC